MRQRIKSGRAWAMGKRLDLDVVEAWVRGGENHCVSLLIRGGRIVYYYPTKNGLIKETPYRWQPWPPTTAEKWKARQARKLDGA